MNYEAKAETSGAARNGAVKSGAAVIISASATKGTHTHNMNRHAGSYAVACLRPGMEMGLGVWGGVQEFCCSDMCCSLN